MSSDESKEREFVPPARKIMSMQDMVKWKNSEAYFDYMGFVMTMNEAVKGKKISDIGNMSQLVENMISMLDKLDKWIDEIPPIEQPQRFGNKAFRLWYNRVVEEKESLLKEALPEDLHPSIVEISAYLTDSFGNSTRIDYGTGHEMAFAMLLCCLFKLGGLKEEDSAAVVLKIFERYLVLMRKLQMTYKLEPAGSHGVWSLDDYQFLPFIWGSAQLTGNMQLEPKSFPNEEVVRVHAKEYMFLECIRFINQVKTGPFHEHSNQLWNISGVPAWDKINKGLIKMYTAEVLGKFPVIQHTLFGSLLSINPSAPNSVPSSLRHGLCIGRKMPPSVLQGSAQ